ncbi:MAG: Bro-N domain-containing protein [Oscillospiraceae bacterium]|nr:Bro-N domain-containing protein [Oscillospiraceae bacterium]
MNEIKVWNYESSEVRAIEKDGEPWFIGKDVADILGYTNTAKAIRDHVDDEDKLTERIVLSGQNREVIFINESGLYSLILSSKMPDAKKFKRWVTSEVLPSIRKTGNYSMQQADTLAIQRMEAEARQNRAIAMRINAENRRMKLLLEHPNMDQISPIALETMGLKRLEQVTGVDVGNALPKTEQTYSATEVGKMLGGISANKIGTTANRNGLKTEEYGIKVMDKSRYSTKEVPSFRYNMAGVKKLAEILGVDVSV